MFANLTLEAIWVKSVPGCLDVLALGGLAALGAGEVLQDVSHVLPLQGVDHHGLDILRNINLKSGQHFLLRSFTSVS